MLRNWGLVFAGNYLGAMAIAVVAPSGISETPNEVSLKIGHIGEGRTLGSAAQAEAVLRVLVTDRVQPGQVFAPIHWTDRNAPSGRVRALVPPRVDPVSGQPVLKDADFRMAPYPAVWFGFAAAARPFRPTSDYWTIAPFEGGIRAELAGLAPPADWGT
jgi:assimilatory nitrate reductase catalytic subunit